MKKALIVDDAEANRIVIGAIISTVLTVEILRISETPRKTGRPSLITQVFGEIGTSQSVNA